MTVGDGTSGLSICAAIVLEGWGVVVRRWKSLNVSTTTPSKRHLLRLVTEEVAGEGMRFEGPAVPPRGSVVRLSNRGESLRRLIGRSGVVRARSWATRLEGPAASRRARKASVGELGIWSELRLALFLRLAGVIGESASGCA